MTLQLTTSQVEYHQISNCLLLRHSTHFHLRTSHIQYQSFPSPQFPGTVPTTNNSPLSRHLLPTSHVQNHILAAPHFSCTVPPTFNSPLLMYSTTHFHFPTSHVQYHPLSTPQLSCILPPTCSSPNSQV